MHMHMHTTNTTPPTTVPMIFPVENFSLVLEVEVDVESAKDREFPQVF